MKEIWIYTTESSPKFKYVMDFIFGNVLSAGYILVSDNSQLTTGPAFSYGMSISSAMNIPCSQSFENYRNQEPALERELINRDGEFSFDFIAAMFYLLARVEEYGEVKKDGHGRYMYESSILARKGLLEIPVVDFWIKELRELIISKWQIDIPYQKAYDFNSTVDIDHWYAYAHKPFLVKTGGMFRDAFSFKLDKLKDRFSGSDPFDRIDDMISWHQNLELELIFFILTSERTAHDKSLCPESDKFRECVQDLSGKNTLGVHPSYYAEEKNAISSQKEKLESIMGKKIIHSRQHYLRLNIPSTYHQLMLAGISEDHTMGYPDVLGFRAGTSYTFNWYDLENDCATDLLVHPFQVMDVTMKNYLKLSPEEGLEKAKELIDIIKSVNGNFGLVWHNSSFYEREGWAGWEKVYKSILEYAKP